MFPPRELPSVTLDQIAGLVDPVGVSTTIAKGSSMSVTMGGDEGVLTILQDGEHRREFVVTAAVEPLAGLLKVPLAFLERQDGFLKDAILNHLLRGYTDELFIDYVGDSVIDVRPERQERIETGEIVQVASRVLGSDAQVVDWWKSGGEFRLDVVVADRRTASRAIADPGDVGDYCLGGLRFSQDYKHNLAPAVEEFWLRLACTNGFEYEDRGERVDLRGMTPDDFMTEFEALCVRKSLSVVERMRDFYSLKGQKVANVEQVVLRHAQESGLTDRVTTGLIGLVPTYIPDSTEVTMFDVVNMLTNVAQGGDLKSGVRRTLERMGGRMSSDHSARCQVCSSKLVTV